MLAMCALAGCIPSAPVEGAPPLPTGKPGAALPALPEPAAKAGASGGGGMGLHLFDVEQSNAGVQVLERQDGRGYDVKGTFGLDGTILKDPATPEWTFQAKFAFPTGGYTVGKPYLSSLGVPISESGEDLLDFHGTLILNVPVTLPAPGAVTTQAIEEVPVSMQFTAAPDVKFVVALTSI
ncbi:MAG: hypothetical protein HYV26_10275 [Candidatus Hydrogenedentes bacterium]|nr:hypothetical protein [Candidatus Hydrogenedentota bacterium]